jgi:prepilin-type N-terminal cleavage/methylation domain-containing protein
MRSRGFTLIEIMAVVIIMALLATAAALSFARPMRVARARDAVDQVRSLDASARQFARRFGRPIEIVFDLSNGTIARRERDVIAFQTSLPRGCQIDEVRAGAQSFSLGEASIQCAASGMSRTYAVHLLGPELDQWLIFAGLSGQVTQVNDVSQLDEILPQANSRDDAD